MSTLRRARPGREEGADHRHRRRAHGGAGAPRPPRPSPRSPRSSSRKPGATARASSTCSTPGAISQAEFDRQTSQCTSQQWSADRGPGAAAVGDQAPGRREHPRARSTGSSASATSTSASTCKPARGSRRSTLRTPCGSSSRSRRRTSRRSSRTWRCSFTVDRVRRPDVHRQRQVHQPQHARVVARPRWSRPSSPTPTSSSSRACSPWRRIELGEKPHPVVPKSAVRADDTRRARLRRRPTIAGPGAPGAARRDGGGRGGRDRAGREGRARTSCVCTGSRRARRRAGGVAAMQWLAALCVAPADLRVGPHPGRLPSSASPATCSSGSTASPTSTFPSSSSRPRSPAPRPRTSRPRSPTRSRRRSTPSAASTSCAR